MNAITLLKDEHETAKRMFGQIRAARAQDRGELWAKLKPELKVHEQMEEEALYDPAARELGSKDQTLKDWQAHHHQKISELEVLIQKIDGLEPAADQWVDRIKELEQTLEHHIQDEEGDIWPRIEHGWDHSTLEQAGQRIQTLKREKMSRAA